MVNSSLCHSSVERLAKTWLRVDKEVMKVKNEISDLFDASSNWKNYRFFSLFFFFFHFPFLSFPFLSFPFLSFAFLCFAFFSLPPLISYPPPPLQTELTSKHCSPPLSHS